MLPTPIAQSKVNCSTSLSRPRLLAALNGLPRPKYRVRSPCISSDPLPDRGIVPVMALEPPPLFSPGGLPQAASPGVTTMGTAMASVDEVARRAAERKFLNMTFDCPERRVDLAPMRKVTGRAASAEIDAS